MLRRRRSLAVALLAATLTVSGLGVPSAAAVAPSTAPATVSPAPYDVDVPRSPVFAWQAVSGATKYRFQVATNEAFTGPLYDVVTYGLHATPAVPLPVGELYWHVAAQDAASAQGPWSDTVPFTVAASDTPVLASPADGAVLTYPAEPPVLTWLPVPGAKSYTVEVDDLDTFATPASYTTVSSQLALTEPPLLDTTHFWRVKATLSTSPVVATAFSSPWTFTASWPTGPVPSAPANGATVSELRLAWSALPGAKTYEVQVSPNGDFQNNPVSLVGATAVMGTEYAPAVELQPQAYYWRVRAKDTATTTHLSPWSAESTFTLSTVPAPGNLQPGADLADTPPVITEPTFTWDGVERASYYEIQIGTDQNFSNAPSFMTCRTNHRRLTVFLDGPKYDCNVSFSGSSRYFWRVRGVSAKPYNGDWSTAKSFYFGHGSMPSDLSPAWGATVKSPQVSWAPVTGFNKYRVKYRKSGATSMTAQDVYTTSFTLPVDPASAAGLYYWTVQTVDANGNVGAVPLVEPSFTLEAPSTFVPSITPLAPLGGSTVDMPAMSWTPVEGVQSYSLFVRGVGGSVYLPLKSGLKTTTWTSPAEPLGAGTYEWIVQALGASGESLGISGDGTFTIVEPDRVVVTGPDDCITNTLCASNPDTPTLSWEPVPYAYKYVVHLATDPNFANPLDVHVTQHTTITFPEQLADNQAGQSYYWYVQVCKSPTMCGPFQDGNLAQYEVSFRKATPPVQLLAPAHGATTGDDPHFTWEPYFTTDPAASPARRYVLEVATSAQFAVPLVDSVTVDQTTYTPFAKAYPDGVYYWRVQVLDAEGLKLTSSAIRSFTKSSLQPVLDDVATTTPLPTLTWSPLPYVGSYKVEVFTGLTTNGTPILTVSSKLPAFTPTAALPAGTYTWRVAKLDASGNRGPWSLPSTFSVAFPAPALLTPTNGELLATDDLLFTWTRPSVSVVSYRFQSSTGSLLSPLFESQVTAGQSWASPKKYADGVKHYWRVFALDAGGNTLAYSPVYSFTKDTARPTVVSAAPTAELPVVGTSLTVAFSEPVKNVTSTTLVVFPKGSPSLVIPGRLTQSADKKSVAFAPTSPLVPGRTYTVSASSAITDVVGNALVPLSLDRRAARVVDSTSPVVRELWDTDSATSASGGSYATSRQAGSSMTFTVAGSSLRLLGTVGPLGGYANVYLDGQTTPSKVSFYRSATAYRSVVWSRTGLSTGTHSVRVVVLGGTPPTGSKSTYVYPDAISGATLVQDSSARQAFARVAASGAFGGSYDRELFDPSGDSGGKPEFRLDFYGTGIDLHAVKTSSSGKVRIYVDSTYRDVDLYAATTTYNSRVFSITGLSATTPHRVRVISLGTRNASSSHYSSQLDQAVVR